MNKIVNLYSMIAGKVGTSKIKFVLFLLALVLFVLGSGAPESGGGIIDRCPIFRF